MIAIGDTFETSWGYDQTNYEFVVVTRVSSSGKVCWVKESASRIEENRSSPQSDALVPTGAPLNEKEYRMKVIQDSRGKDELIGQAYCHRTMGWLKVEPTEVFQQTALGFGH